MATLRIFYDLGEEYVFASHKPVDQGPQRLWGVSEAFGYLFYCSFFKGYGPDCFSASLIPRASGLIDADHSAIRYSGAGERIMF